MANIIPEAGINFAVYVDGLVDMVGVAEGEFPNIEAMTTTVKGAGLAGEIEMPILGHIKAMSAGLTWRNISNAFVGFTAFHVYDLDLYSVEQDFDAGAMQIVPRDIHLYLKAIAKTSTGGNLNVADLRGTKTEFSILYYKMDVSGVNKIEIDPMNYIYKVEGVDYLAAVREGLGK